MRTPRKALLTLSALVIALGSANAETFLWDKTTGNTNWNVAANWITNGVTASTTPGAADIVRSLDNHTVAQDPYLTGSESVLGLNIDNGYNHEFRINGDGTLTIGTSGIELTYYRFYVYPDVVLNGAQTWTINQSTRGTDFQLHGTLTGSGPLTVTTAATSDRGDGTLYYYGPVAGSSFTGGLTITRPRAVDASLRVLYDIGNVSAAGDYAFGGAVGSPETIAIDNAKLEVTADAADGGNSPGHILNVVNPLNVQSGGAQIEANQGNSDGHNPNIRFSGDMSLGGFLSGAINRNGDVFRVTGDITLKQDDAESVGISDSAEDYSSVSEEYSGGIADGSGTFQKPIVLRNYNTSWDLISAAAGMTYSHGTVIEHTGSAYNGNTRPARIGVDAASRLGTGPVKILPGGALQINADSNIPAGQSVEIESSMLANGTLALNYDGMPPIATDASGVIAIDGTYSSPLDLSALGDGNMFLGSRDGGTFSGSTLAPGNGDLYRLGGGRQSTALTVSQGVLSGTAGLQVGCAKWRGGGTVYLTATNTFEGQIDVIGLPEFWREPDITGEGSFLRGTAANGGSPFGNTNGIVFLHCGMVGLTQGNNATPVRKEELVFEGRGRLYVDCNNYENYLTFGSLSRTNNGVLTVFPNRLHLGGLERILIENPPAQPQGTLPPWFVNGRELSFLSHDSTTGIVNFASYEADVNAADATKIVGGFGALTDNRICHAAKVTGGALSGAFTLTIDGGGLLLNGSSADVSCDVDFGTAEGIIINNGTPEITGVVSGSGGLTFSSYNGHTILRNTNSTFTGGIAVSGGTLYADFDTATRHGSLGPTSNDILLNGGGLVQHKLSGNVGTELSAARTLTLGASGGFLCGENTIYSKITGPGTLMIDSETRSSRGGTVTIASSQNDYTGGTRTLASSGGQATLVATAAASLGTGDLLVEPYTVATLQGDANVDSNASVHVVMHGTVTMESAAPSVGGLMGTGDIKLGTSSSSTKLKVGGTDVDSTFYGEIYEADSGFPCGLTKTGSGTFTLYGGHDYTGATTVDDGTLVLMGSVASNLTVNAGGTLAGIGYAGGALTVDGTLRITSTNGTLTAGQSITLNGNLQIALAETPPWDSQWLALSTSGTVSENLSSVTTDYRVFVEGGNVYVARPRKATVLILK